MLQGDLLEEIRTLPEKQVHRFALESVDSKLEKGIISTDTALDICDKILKDYQREKQEIIDSLNKSKKITVIDAIMGTGKSTYIIDKVINTNPQQRFLCVLKTLDECKRYVQNIDADIFEPKNRRTKTRGLRELIANGRNIATTHALIQNIDDITMELLRLNNYVLVIDECLDVVHEYKSNFKTSDLKTLFEDGYVTVDDKGFLIWNNEKQKEYDGRYNDIKQLCSLHSLMRLKNKNGEWSDKVLIWNFPVSFFSLFEKCYICTYLWNGSVQMAYFKLHGIEYLHMTLNDGKLDIYNPTRELIYREKYWKLINLYKGNLNKIGEKSGKDNPLTATWYQRKSRTETGRNYLTILKNNTYNYFRNVAKTASSENMYTTFKDYRKYVKAAGYTKGFVSCNAKATNDYRNKKTLAYLINLYPYPQLIQFFEMNGVELNQDLYAISELLQWIWRSAIRDEEYIDLYLPSVRMSELLGMWVLGKI